MMTDIQADVSDDVYEVGEDASDYRFSYIWHMNKGILVHYPVEKLYQTHWTYHFNNQKEIRNANRVDEINQDQLFEMVDDLDK